MLDEVYALRHSALYYRENRNELQGCLQNWPTIQRKLNGILTQNRHSDGERDPIGAIFVPGAEGNGRGEQGDSDQP